MRTLDFLRIQISISIFSATAAATAKIPLYSDVQAAGVSDYDIRIQLGELSETDGSLRVLRGFSFESDRISRPKSVKQRFLMKYIM